MGKPALQVVSASGTAPAFKLDYSYDHWVEDLRGLVWRAFIKGRMTIEDIAVKADLRESTVENFIWEKTKRPQARTVFQLAAAVEFPIPMLSQGTVLNFIELRSAVRALAPKK